MNARAKTVGAPVLLLAALMNATTASAQDAPRDEVVDPSPATEPVARTRVIEEIVVTANRRVQNLQEIGGGIAVLGGEALEKAGAAGFEDYLFSLPGVDFANNDQETKITIRGIGNLVTNPAGVATTASPVGLYLNETPIQGMGILPDLPLYDLERIELLKGPQGTLYGEGSQGGAVKMLLNKADPSELMAKGDLSVGQTRFAGGLNHAQNLALNVPLSDSWAVRLVGSRRFDAGYIDFPNRGTSDENDATNLLGRIHADGELWGVSVSAMVMYERQRLEQFSQVQADEPDLTNRNSEDQFADTDFALAGLTLEYDLGFATLTSSTSGFYNHRTSLGRLPIVNEIIFSNFAALGGPPPGASAADNEWALADNRQFSLAQEFRLVSEGDSWLHWIVGAFYRQRSNEFNANLDNDGPAFPPPAEQGTLLQTGEENFEQFAGFGEITLDLPWDLELTTGGRLLYETADFVGDASWQGAFYAISVAAGEPDGTIGPESFESSVFAVAPKVAVNWYIDDQRMIYALAANGVRSGGTNILAVFTTIEPTYEPDSLWSYEVGVKTQWFGQLLTANAAFFLNDWKDLQVSTTDPTAEFRGSGVPFTTGLTLNVGHARSLGAELELLALPIEGLTLSFGLALLHGKILEGDSEGTIEPNSSLPNSPRFSYAASARYEEPAWSMFGFVPFASFDTQYTAKRLFSPEVANLPDLELEGFQLYGAQVGLLGERFDFILSAKNLTDARPEHGLAQFSATDRTIGPPRTLTAAVGFRW